MKLSSSPDLDYTSLKYIWRLLPLHASAQIISGAHFWLALEQNPRVSHQMWATFWRKIN
jgi:hypothetical protein